MMYVNRYILPSIAKSKLMKLIGRRKLGFLVMNLDNRMRKGGSDVRCATMLGFISKSTIYLVIRTHVCLKMEKP
ncbi:hypothetical protein HanIR_Chr13g0630711 [Helianthus annuus]|nr:hypothetical protein HanIR_Chr13g0630711 [Helianthus annuus]